MFLSELDRINTIETADIVDLFIRQRYKKEKHIVCGRLRFSHPGSGKTVAFIECIYAGQRIFDECAFV